MKIVHFEDHFHPDAGYQLNVLAKYMARDGHDVIIITGEVKKMPSRLNVFFGANNIKERDQEYEKNFGVRIIRIPLLAFVKGRFIYDCRMIWKVVNRIRPDIIYIHGNDTYVGIRVALGSDKCSYPIVMDSHMLDIASANKFRGVFRWFYKRFVTPHIIKNRIPVIRTADDDYVEKRLGIPLNQAPFIPLGTDTMLFHRSNRVRQEFRKQNDIADEAIVVLYAGKMNSGKGGKLLAELTRQDFNIQKELVFIIVGNTEGEYGKEVEKLFELSNYRVIRYPTQKYINLPVYYQSADIAVIPRECSMSMFDFAASGLPVVAEDNSTNADRIKKLGEGKLFRSNDIKDFKESVEYYINMDTEALNKKSVRIATTSKDLFGFDRQYPKYLDVIRTSCNIRIRS